MSVQSNLVCDALCDAAPLLGADSESSGFRWELLHGFHQLDLLSIDESGMPLLIVENHGLPVRTDRDVIGVGDKESLLAAEHNSYWLERHGVHQLFDFIRDHGAKHSGSDSSGQDGIQEFKEDGRLTSSQRFSPEIVISVKAAEH
jgi:hypothetical protein